MKTRLLMIYEKYNQILNMSAIKLKLLLYIMSIASLL